ncbi:hypothetical protein BD311DRAFT_276494 [Dichomitus squalens]|uniref:Uncharacterized protein n=1 Tax=Dichomitus squalens TaxID=114155 RepID=A0A4Q9MQI4_9APHY|nr:hypothetical protein BD311DRAFT_276494 [Dichomitus squalens]
MIRPEKGPRLPGLSVRCGRALPAVVQMVHARYKEFAYPAKVPHNGPPRTAMLVSCAVLQFCRRQCGESVLLLAKPRSGVSKSGGWSSLAFCNWIRAPDISSVSHDLKYVAHLTSYHRHHPCHHPIRTTRSPGRRLFHPCRTYVRSEE